MTRSSELSRCMVASNRLPRIQNLRLHAVLLLCMLTSLGRAFPQARKVLSSRRERLVIQTKHPKSVLYNQYSSSISKMDNKARLVNLPQDLDGCIERLKQGKLVAFPTETVYGLGANALDADACRGIFAAKERPLTDPLIVHVLDFESARPLWAATNNHLELQILELICTHFWPGPLTVVAKAAVEDEHNTDIVVPPLLMAGTGYVACRSPAHPTARLLIQSSGLPLAAPSANKFGHVSPTKSQHVYDDLYNEDVWIVQESDSDTGVNDDNKFGVESTVVKVEVNSDQIVLCVLRQGAISMADLQNCLDSNDMSKGVTVTSLQQSTSDDTANVAPGQTIRHYSPNTPSFLLSQRAIEAYSSDKSTDSDAIRVLQKAVIIDFGAQLAAWQDDCIAYRDLSSSSNSREAAQQVFDTLRWAENVDGAHYIFFPEIQPHNDEALLLAVKDRLTRAASGVVVDDISSVQI